MNIIYLTLLHALWQGFVLAIATALVLYCSKRSTAAVRYRLLTSCLSLFAAGIACTLVCLIRQSGDFVTPGVARMSLPIPTTYVWTGLADYLTAHAAYVVGCWMTIVGFRGVQLTIGLRNIYQLRHNQVFDTGRYWQQRVADMAVQSGISCRVRILQSALARTPLVIGHFKPLILIPLGLINHLSTAEVEAILRHELAHIRRRDFLVNLLQSLLEALFFFHPAVLWINRLIREEREHCCDDLALSGAGVGAGEYIQALVSCQSFRSAHPGFAMAFAGAENHLLSRVQRILRHPDDAGRRPVKRVLAGILFAVVLISMVFFKMDGLGTQTIVRRSVEENEQEKIVTEEIVREPASKETTIGAARQQRISGKCAVKPAHEDEAATIEKQARETAREASAENEKARLMVCDAANYDALAAIADAREPIPFTEQDGKNLRNDLESDGLIKQHTTFSYKLNSEELVVNDQRQPDSIHRRYAARYVQQSGRSILYNYNYTCAVTH